MAIRQPARITTSGVRHREATGRGAVGPEPFDAVLDMSSLTICVGDLPVARGSATIRVDTLVYLHGSVNCRRNRSEEHTSELQSLMRISYAVFCLKKKKRHIT